MDPEYYNENYFRTFSCETCGYQAQVAGERYFDKGCHHYMETYHCHGCNKINDYLVSEIDMYRTLPYYNEIKKIFPDFDIHMPEEYDKISFKAGELDIFAEQKEVEPNPCLGCGSTNHTKWVKENPYCPKCGGVMKMSIDPSC